MPHISIIIPTLNEEQHISSTLDYLAAHGNEEIDKEIIVLDNGSSDQTVAIVKRTGIRVIDAAQLPKGRAYLLSRGAGLATADVLMFLDADCIVPLGYDQSIMQTLDDKQYIGGAFSFALDGDQWGLRVVETVNRLRYHIFPWYYGDQGVFVRRESFEKAGGFPRQAMMASSDLCRKLWKLGSLRLIRKPMITSSRRFVENGVFAVLGRDFKIWLQDILGRDVEKYAKAYWGFNLQGQDENQRE